MDPLAINIEAAVAVSGLKTFLLVLAYLRMSHVVVRLQAGGKHVPMIKRLKIFGGALSIALIGLFAALFGLTVGSILAGAAFALLFPPAAQLAAIIGGAAGGLYAFIAMQLRLWRYQDAVERGEVATRLGWR